MNEMLDAEITALTNELDAITGPASELIRVIEKEKRYQYHTTFYGSDGRIDSAHMIPVAPLEAALSALIEALKRGTL